MKTFFLKSNPLQGFQRAGLFEYFLLRILSLTLGILVAARLFDGIRYESTQALVGTVLLLTVFNVLLKPALVLFTLPFVVITLGLGLLVINAALLYLSASMIPGFFVDSFIVALGGACVIGLVNFVIGFVFHMVKGGFRKKLNSSPKSQSNRDIIDID